MYQALQHLLRGRLCHLGCGMPYVQSGSFLQACKRGLLAYVLLSVSHSAYAQSLSTLPPQQAAEEGLRRQEDRARELQQQIEPHADVLVPRAAPAISTELPDETPCFVIQEIRFEGPDASRFGWLAKEAHPYLGRCLGVTGLRRIADALDAKLIEWGYVTSKVSLPQQNLSDGILDVRLHVGRVAGVSVLTADKARTPDEAWGTWRNAFPVSAGDILNVRDLEQGVEQMKRLPSQTVATELEPGAEADTSNVHILRQAGTVADRIRGGITLDNSGGETLGRTQLSAHLSHDNLLGLNDILSLSANTNAEKVAPNRRSQSLAFNYSLPWGYNTFTLSRNYSRFAQIVQGTTVRFLSSGSSEGADLRWHRTMLRTSAAKFGVFAAVGTRRARSFLDDVELIVQRRRTSNIETGVTYKQLIDGASVELELGYRRGMPWRNAQDDLPTAAQGGPTLRPKIWTLSSAYYQQFKIGDTPLQYSATLRGQHTRDTTLSIDQLAIGSRYTVRGFDGDSVLLAESGYALRNDLSIPVKLIGGVDTSAYIGIDFGRVWGPSAIALVGDQLTGAALGLRGGWKGLQFDLALGTPLHKPDGFRTDNWNAYLSASWAF